MLCPHNLFTTIKPILNLIFTYNLNYLAMWLKRGRHLKTTRPHALRWRGRSEFSSGNLMLECPLVIEKGSHGNHSKESNSFLSRQYGLRNSNINIFLCTKCELWTIFRYLPSKIWGPRRAKFDQDRRAVVLIKKQLFGYFWFSTI